MKNCIVDYPFNFKLILDEHNYELISRAFILASKINGTPIDVTLSEKAAGNCNLTTETNFNYVIIGKYIR